MSVLHCLEQALETARGDGFNQAEDANTFEPTWLMASQQKSSNQLLSAAGRLLAKEREIKLARIWEFLNAIKFST